MKWGLRVFAYAYRDWLFASRTAFSIVEMLFWPMVGMLSIGLMGDFLQLNSSLKAFVLTGAIVGGTLQVSQLDVAYALLHDVWSKSVKHTFLTPTGELDYFIGPWLVGVGRGLIVFGLLTFFSMRAFQYSLPGWGPTVLLLVGVFLTALLLGIFVGILVLHFGQKAEISAWAFSYLFVLLAGMYYPAKQLPPFFFYIAQWIPLTYFLEYFRSFFGPVSGFTHPLLKGFGLFGVGFGLDIFLLRRAMARARRSGVLLRLSE